MKNKMKKLAMLAIIFACSNVKAESLILEDSTYTITGVPVGALVENLAVRFGTWNSATSTFTQAIFGPTHSGYAAIANEISASLSLTSNSTYSQGTQFAIAFFAKTSIADSSDLDWTSPGVNYAAILTDSTWTAPAFGNSSAGIPFNMGASTTALNGSYSYNSGNQIIGVANLDLAAVPEPSVASLFALGTVGLVALRARRKS